MRKLFIPLAKILGIYLLYRPLTHLTSIVYFLFSDFSPESQSIWSGILYTIISQVLIALLALILLFKTEYIADVVRLPDDDINLAALDRYSIFYTGLIIIGVVIIICAIPAFLGTFVAYLKYRDITPPSLYYQALEKMISSTLRMILGFILIFRSVSIARFFDKQP